MRYSVVLIASTTLLCLYGQAPPPPKEAPPEYKGMPARATPGDYQFQAKAGSITIAAEFAGHSLPTAEGPLTTEDYVAVEVALYGPAGERLKISRDDFTLRINGKKSPLPTQQFAAVFSSLKDPEYIPEDAPSGGGGGKGSKTGITTGGNKGNSADGPPPPVKIPVPVMRAMAQRVQKAALPEGGRALPQAGLIFFGYRGKEKGIQSVELAYEGPAGKATLELK
jgi:hypothetical protein